MPKNKHPEYTHVVYVCVAILQQPAFQKPSNCNSAAFRGMCSFSPYTTQEELDVWCAKADLFIRDRLMPFFQRISTAEGIACYLKEAEQDLEKRGYAPPGSLSILRFRWPIEPLMYAELAAHELDRAVRAAHAYLAKIEEYAARRPLGEEVRQSMEAQAHQVLDLAAAMDPQAVDAVLNGWRKHNAAFVAGTTAAEG